MSKNSTFTLDVKNMREKYPFKYCKHLLVFPWKNMSVLYFKTRFKKIFTSERLEKVESYLLKKIIKLLSADKKFVVVRNQIRN